MSVTFQSWQLRKCDITPGDGGADVVAGVSGEGGVPSGLAVVPAPPPGSAGRLVVVSPPPLEGSLGLVVGELDGAAVGDDELGALDGVAVGKDRHTERQCPARTWTNFLPEKHLRLFRHLFRSWQATARPPKPFLPFGVCLNSPGERHLATSSHALNTAKIEQRVPKLPVRLQMSESNRLGAGT